MRVGSYLLGIIVGLMIFSPIANYGARGNPLPAASATLQSAPLRIAGPPQSSESQSPTDPVDVTRNYPSTPAPTGIADYGVEDIGGRSFAYKMALSSVTGTAMLNGVSSDSSNGMSLQLNAVIRVNTSSATYVYWLQNFFWPSQRAILFHSDLNSAIWNWTVPYAGLNPARISGTHGSLLGSCYGTGCVESNVSSYQGSMRFSNYSLPIGLRLRINVSYTESRVSVGFSDASAEGAVPFSTHTSPYDEVTIYEPNTIISAAILVDGHEMAPGIQLGRLTYYEADFAFAALCCLETTTFNYMNSTLSMSYTLENGSVIAPLSVYEFGQTGEKATNLAVTPLDQRHGFQFHVGLGKMNSQTNYVRQPRSLDRLTMNYSFPGEPPSGMTAVLDYVNNGTETFVSLGRSPTTLRADAGTEWQIITDGLPSNSTERWALSQGNGVVSGAQTIHTVYFRQFLIQMEFSVAGGGTGYSSPIVTFHQFGSMKSLQADTYVWVDAGTMYTYSGILMASNSSVRWVSNETSGTIMGPGEIQAIYDPQYEVTITATSGGMVSYGFGSTTGTVSPGTSQSFYVSPGTQILVRATPSSFWYGFNGWIGLGEKRGSQIQEIVASPTVLEGEFSVDLVKVAGTLTAIGMVLFLLQFARRRRGKAHFRRTITPSQ